MQSSRPRSSAALLYMVVLSIVGWGLLAWPSLGTGIGPETLSRPDWLSVGMFLVVIVATRAMAVRLLEQSVVSLDAGFYLSASVCLGSLMSGRLIAIALLVDAGLRGVTQAKGSRSWLLQGVYGLYFGGMSGGLLLVVSWLGNLDALFVLEGVSDLQVLIQVMLVGLVFLVAHYSLQSVRLVLMGESPRSVIRDLAVPGILGECTVLPLAVLVVFVYEPAQPLKFALLGTTFLVLNFAFHRLSRTQAQLQDRVRELETLSATSKRLAASLQLHELVETLAQEVLTVVPRSGTVVLGHREDSEGEPQQFRVDSFDRDAPRFERVQRNPGEGAMGLVLASGRPKYFPRLEASHKSEGLERAQSWLGVPIAIQEKTEGVLAIYSEEANAFDDEDLMLLEAIAGQAAIALQNVRLYELAMVDGLTGLYVRRYFDARLREEFERTSRFETPFSLVMMDLDNFKALNDTYGHPVGDRALRAVASAVKSQMRLVDTAARYGGEEIVLILPRTRLQEAVTLAERIRTTIENLAIDNDKGGTLELTASIGIAAHPGSEARDPEGLLRRADEALYRAKGGGKNRVELAR